MTNEMINFVGRLVEETELDINEIRESFYKKFWRDEVLIEEILSNILD